MVCLGTVHGNVDIRALAHSVSVFFLTNESLDGISAYIYVFPVEFVQLVSFHFSKRS